MGKKIQYLGHYVMDGVVLGKGNFARVELATHKIVEVKVTSLLASYTSLCLESYLSAPSCGIITCLLSLSLIYCLEKEEFGYFSCLAVCFGLYLQRSCLSFSIKSLLFLSFFNLVISLLSFSLSLMVGLHLFVSIMHTPFRYSWLLWLLFSF